MVEIVFGSQEVLTRGGKDIREAHDGIPELGARNDVMHLVAPRNGAVGEVGDRIVFLFALLSLAPAAFHDIRAASGGALLQSLGSNESENRNLTPFGFLRIEDLVDQRDRSVFPNVHLAVFFGVANVVVRLVLFRLLDHLPSVRAAVLLVRTDASSVDARAALIGADRGMKFFVFVKLKVSIALFFLRCHISSPTILR